MLPMHLRCSRRCCLATSWTNENMHRRQLEPLQSFTTGMPAKFNSSQLRRHAGSKDWEENHTNHFCSHIRTVSQVVPVAMSQVHQQHMRNRL